jgi:tRNA uridine 5-carboxymethylaminomethyl modification enzyme
MGDFPIPADIEYSNMKSLSHEARQKLGSIRPRTLAQASRISGVSPSDIQNLVIEIGRRRTVALSS